MLQICQLMFTVRKLLVISFLLLSAIKMLSAQESKWQKLTEKKFRFVVLPIVSYAPETSWGFGVTSQYILRLKKDTISNPSIMGISFLYTLNNQFILNPNWDFFLKQNKLRISGAFVFQRYPDYFFGIGNNTSSEDRERFSADYIMAKNRILRKVGKGFFIGTQYRFERVSRMQVESNSIFIRDSILGFEGYQASGSGISLVYDTRDNILYPFKGFYITLSHHSYSRWMRSDYPFTNLNFDARYYWNVKRSHILAWNYFMSFNIGEAPFRMLPMLGGPNLMRGYFMGRYRERFMIAGQAEYRFPIWWRFMGAAFVGAGDVFYNAKDFTRQKLKVSGGLGLRLTLDAKERFNLRFDAAFGRINARGFYLSLTEAF